MRTYEEILAGLPEDEREVVVKYEKAASDKRVQDGIKTYLAGHPVPDEKGTLSRLDKIEAAHRAAVEASELRFVVFRECAESGVNFELVENVPFSDAAAARTWIKRLGETHKKIAVEADHQAREAVIFGSGFRPGSGNGPGAGENPALRVLNREERELASMMNRDGSLKGQR